jgi:hypothetical protein
MKTRAWGEGKNIPLGEKFFSTTYAVPIFSQKAIERWLKARTSVIDYSTETPYRLFKVRTLSMNLVQDAPTTKKTIQAS